MALETKPEPPVVTPKSSPDDIRAAIAPHAARLHPGAESHLAKLFGDEFGQTDPSLLPDAIKARLDQPEYSLFVKPAVQPGSVEESAAKYKALMREQGSLAGATIEPNGTVTIQAGDWTRQAQPGTPAGDELAARQARAHATAINELVQKTGVSPFAAAQIIQVEAGREALRVATGIVLKK